MRKGSNVAILAHGCICHVLRRTDVRRLEAALHGEQLLRRRGEGARERPGRGSRDMQRHSAALPGQLVLRRRSEPGCRSSARVGEGLRPAPLRAPGSSHLRLRAPRGRILRGGQLAEGRRRGDGLLGRLLQVVAAERLLGPRPLPGRQAWLRGRRRHAGRPDGVLRIRDDAPPGGPVRMPLWRDALPGLRREHVLPSPPGPVELRRQRPEPLGAARRQPRDRPHPPRPPRLAGQGLHGHGLRRVARRLGHLGRPPRPC